MHNFRLTLPRTLVAGLFLLLLSSGTAFAWEAPVHTDIAKPFVLEAHKAPAVLLPASPSPSLALRLSRPVPEPDLPAPPPPPKDMPRPAVSVDPPLTIGRMTMSQPNISSPTDFLVYRNTDLMTSLVGADFGWTPNEPAASFSTADVVWYTGNMYAAVSFDGGQTFNNVAPLSAFPGANNYGGFGGDQWTIYDKPHNLIIWLSQYNDDGTTNCQRLAVITPEALKNGGNWTYWDLVPGQMGWQPYDRWFDFPDISTSVDYLYGSTNVFNMAHQGLGCDLWRVSLNGLAAGQWESGSYIDYDAGRTGVRLMKGRDSTMYGGCWAYEGAIDFFNWGDWSNELSWKVCPVGGYSHMAKYEGHAYSPDGTDWANYADSRILGCWGANSMVGFMWACKQDDSHPYPYVSVARLTWDKHFFDQHKIWSPSFAVLYPCASPNARGDIGGSFEIGGGAEYPQTCVYIVDDVNGQTWQPVEGQTVTNGTNGPGTNRWGDYQTSQVHPGFGGNTWVATGFCQVGGTSTWDAHPHLIWFGRERDLPADIPAYTTLNPYGVPKYWSIGIKDAKWGAIGIDPGASDHDISISTYNDLSNPYASSTMPGALRDFVVTNGWHWGNATHYAMTSNGSEDSYYIEADMDAFDLALGVPMPSTIQAPEILNVYQGWLTLGRKYTVSVTPQDGNADVGLFVYAPATYGASRANAYASANGGGAGAREQILFQAPTHGSYGFVVTSENGGSSNYQVLIGEAPSNDECANATGIPPLPYSVSQDTRFATTVVSDPVITNCGNQRHGHSVWFYWTATTNGQVQFDTFGSDYDTVLAVYTAPCGTLPSVTCNDDYSGTQSQVTWNASTGTTYYIEVMSYGTTDGGNLVLNGKWAPPANDECSAATTIGLIGDGFTEYTQAATTASNDPSICGSTSNPKQSHSVWFKYTPPVGCTIQADTLGSEYDTVLAVMTGSCGSYTQVACNDDTSSVVRQSKVSWDATAGVTYYIEAAAYGSNLAGKLVLNTTYAVPSNDDCMHPKLIAGLPYSYAENTQGATTAADDPTVSCGNGYYPQQSSSVWFKYTPGVSAPISVNTAGSNYNTVVSVYTGTCGSFTEVACNDTPTGGGIQAALTFDATAGTTYYIEATCFGKNDGRTLQIALGYAPPANDNCSSPTEITSMPFIAAESTIGATTATDDPVVSCGSGIVAKQGHSVWFRYIAGSNATVTADTFGSSYDTVLAVFRGTCGASLIPVACSNDAHGGKQSNVTWSAAQTVVYYIEVTSYGSTAGGSLHFGMSYGTPSNDECVNAANIPSIPFYAFQDTNAATTAANDPIVSCGSATPPKQSHSVWYKYTPSHAAQIQATTNGSTYDTVLEVFTGTCGSYTPVICNNDTTNQWSTVSWTASAGVTYYIEVTSYGSTAGGTLQLSVAYVTPPNDYCEDALLLTSPEDTQTLNTFGSSMASEPFPPCAPAIYNTVWYIFEPRDDGTAVLTTEGSDFDTVLAVYTGTCASLTPVACNDDAIGTAVNTSAVGFPVTANARYFVQVGGANDGEAGTLVLHFRHGPVCTNIDAVKRAAPGTLVSMRGKTVSGVFSGASFIQEPSRSAGIKIYDTATSAGTSVTAIGTTNRTSDGNIEVTNCLAAGTAAGRGLETVGMRGRTVGGSAYGNQAGAAGGKGLNNVGLLVRVNGCVLSIDGRARRYWIDDGSSLNQTPGHAGLLIISYNATMPVQDSYVTVNGFPQITTGGVPAIYQAPTE